VISVARYQRGQSSMPRESVRETRATPTALNEAGELMTTTPEALAGQRMPPGLGQAQQGATPGRGL
jgi:hypothetical protein